MEKLVSLLIFTCIVHTAQVKNLGKTEKNSTPMTLFNAKHVTSINLPRLWWLYIWPGNFVNVEQKIAGYVISSHIGTKNECRVVCGGGRRCKH